MVLGALAMIRIWIMPLLVFLMSAFLCAGEEPGPRIPDEEVSRESIKDLVKQLGSDAWEEREEALQELIRIGEPAIPFLQEAAKSADPEVSMRASKAIEEIDKARPCAFLEQRLEVGRHLRAYGGGRHSEAAVLRGLIWLKYHQNPDGLWACRAFPANCKKGRCTGEGASDGYDLGVTGLAVLAFLGSGHTHRVGKFQGTLGPAMRALARNQTPDGCFGKPSKDWRWIYNHAICTWAACELFGMNRTSAQLRKMAQEAVDFLVDCQNPYLGWRYGRQTGENDTSSTAWAACALKTAESCGLNVPKESFDGALNWFNKVTNEKYSKTGYTGRRPADPAHTGEREGFKRHENMTAAAMFARMMIIGKKASNRPTCLGGTLWLRRDLPDWDEANGLIDMTYWYWGTLAMFQMGRSYWKAWNEPMKNALIPSQKKEGCLYGSWDPVGAWGKTGGRVFATAINTLTLEVYYRYKKGLD